MVQSILAVQEEVNDMPAPKKDAEDTKEEPTTTAPTTSDTAPSTQTEKKGCKGSISVGSVVVLALVPFAALCSKKKKDFEI